MFHMRIQGKRVGMYHGPFHVPWTRNDVPCTDGPFEMYHGPCTVYHVGNLASFAREAAKQEQGKFLNQCAFCVRKGS